MLNQKLKFALILLLLLFSPALSFSCSIFSITDSNSHYLCGNEDWYPSSSAVKIVPGSENEFGYIVFGVKAYLNSYPQIAMNEKGLAVDWATVPYSEFKADPDKEHLNTPLIPELMKHCETVEDVITYIKKFNISHFTEEHLIAADKFGNSIVLEWNNDEVKVIQREKSYQLITNFMLLNPDGGWYPCTRFAAGDKLLKLKESSSFGITGITKVLKAMKSDGEVKTLYSYIFNLSTGEIIIYSNGDYSKKSVLNMDQLLKNGGNTMSLNNLKDN